MIREMGEQSSLWLTGWSSRIATDGLVYQSSYTLVDNELKEVS